MLRGEIWLINLDLTIGAEIRTSYLLSAKGAFSYQPGYHPRGAIIFSTSAESATQCAVPPSIPHIALVELHTVSAQQLSVFLLKSERAVMLLLRFHVLQHRVELAWTHRKGSLSALPEKATIANLKGFDPLGGWLLYPLDHLGLRKRSWQCC